MVEGKKIFRAAKVQVQYFYSLTFCLDSISDVNHYVNS